MKNVILYSYGTRLSVIIEAPTGSRLKHGQVMHYTSQQAVGLSGPKDYINIRISHSGSKAKHKGHTRNHGRSVGSLSLRGLFGALGQLCD